MIRIRWWQSLHQKARRLRWEGDDSEVVPPEIPHGWYHLFLSHGDQSTMVVNVMSMTEEG